MAQAYLARHPKHAGGAVLVNACSRIDRSALIAGFHALGGAQAGQAAEAVYTRGAPEDVPGFFRHCLPFYSRTASLDAARTAGTRGGTRGEGEGGNEGGSRASNRQTFNFEVSRCFFGPDGEAFRYDHRASLGRIECPVLVLTGAHDPVTRPEWGRALRFSMLRRGRAMSPRPRRSVVRK